MQSVITRRVVPGKHRSSRRGALTPRTQALLYGVAAHALGWLWLLAYLHLHR